MARQALRQSIRYVSGSDGVRLAWASTGSGPPLVKAANWLTHLQYDLESPIWRHWIQFFAEHFHFIRYDERGCGMSQWEVPEVSLPRWVDDLELVIDAATLDAPATLLGISQGGAACIAYAVKYPERVSHLILYGGYATGWAKRGDEQGLRRFQAIVELIRLGWGTDTVAFRQVFTSRFAPGASMEQIAWFNELCRRTTTPEIAAHLMLARSEIDVRALLPQLKVPTLVIHAVDDQVTPLNASRELAADIPNAEFVQLESRNHVLLEDEPAWAHFKETVLEFTGRGAAARSNNTHADRFDALSARERDVLNGLVTGRSNAEIASSLFLSEKTIRNIVSRIFEKLEVQSRTQAAVLARDHGFQGTVQR
ncbi:alpha/beta fold hydrolase [Steroidobacter sp.]|uniref:alpha/beta fold hydrolase n=1 Tax=Steroidobacter sp. TaxID=1978227 RepID=UPI001A3C3DD9|nr:alpha/beta fold hydrolase [Steroidobacter sp.]MBL8270888.1 alpha/beta fold hydrolase [Steroidobacter sp.]